MKQLTLLSFLLLSSSMTFSQISSKSNESHIKLNSEDSTYFTEDKIIIKEKGKTITISLEFNNDEIYIVFTDNGKICENENITLLFSNLSTLDLKLNNDRYKLNSDENKLIQQKGLIMIYYQNSRYEIKNKYQSLLIEIIEDLMMRNL